MRLARVQESEAPKRHAESGNGCRAQQHIPEVREGLRPLEGIGDPPLVQVPDVDELWVLLRPDGGEAVSVIGLRPFLDHTFGCFLTRDGVEQGSPDVFGFASGVAIEADPSVMAKMDDDEGTCFLSHVIPATPELPVVKQPEDCRCL